MASTVPERRQSLREARMSRQRKHKRRLYAKQAQHLYSSWEDLKLLSWMEDGRWFDEMLEAFAAYRVATESPLFLGIPLARPPHIVSVTVTA